MITVRVRRTAAVIACALVVGSCGNDGVDPRAAEEIGGTYEVLAAAVAAGDRGQARRTLQDLIDSVEELQEAGDIHAEDAAEILDAASDVSRALRSLPAPTVTPDPDAPTEIAGTSDDPDDDESGGRGHGDDAPGNSGGKGKGKGKAHGHDKD